MTTTIDLASILADAGGFALNVQATSVEAARATTSLGVPVLVGVMMRGYATLEDGVAAVREMVAAGVLVSIGLGDGAADQWDRALRAALATGPLHLNQVFPAAAMSQRVLAEAGHRTVVNALVRPAGVGLVDIATGPLSGDSGERAVVPVGIALDLLLEMGVRSVKLFPVGGLNRLDEIVAVAAAAAERGMLIEPTGGLSPAHLDTLMASLRPLGCPVMPHLYGSLKDTATGDLSLAKLAVAVHAMERAREAR